MSHSAILNRVQALRIAGALDQAYAVLREGAEAGDAEALLQLALWRVSGTEIARDLALARDLFGRAADAGHDYARLIHCYFMASGTGGATEPAAALRDLRGLEGKLAGVTEQIALVENMGDGFNEPATMLNEACELHDCPQVVLRPSFLSRAEVNWLGRFSIGRLQPSMVVDPVTSRLVPNPIRRSEEAIFGVLQEDLVVSAINRRIAAASGMPAENGEPLLILRYKPGGEFRAHSDALGGVDNQRIATMLLYLNSTYEGGETEFPKLGLRIKGRLGDALFFANVDSQGRPEPAALHAGRPVTRGEKWLATRWIRARGYEFPPPTPTLDV